MPNGGPVQQQAPEETRPATTVVPRLSLETTLARAGQAFDNALAALVSTPPPEREMSRLQRLVDRSGDVTGSLESYVASNPDSVMAKYYHLSGEASDWLIVTDENGRHVFGFNSDALVNDLKTFFNKIKPKFLTAIQKLYEDENRHTFPIEETQSIAGFYAAIPSLLSEALTSQFSSEAVNLPVTVAYDSSARKIVVTWQREAPNREYGEEEMTAPEGEQARQ